MTAYNKHINESCDTIKSVHVFAAAANDQQAVDDLMTEKANRYVNMRKIPNKYKTMVIVDRNGQTYTMLKREFFKMFSKACFPKSAS